MPHLSCVHALGPSQASGLASSPSPSPAPTPPKYQRPSSFTRVRFLLKIWLMKGMATLFFKTIRLVHARQLRGFLPNYTKCYPVRPTLENRIFLPKAYTSTDTDTDTNTKSTKYPLLITIHGGGFVLCDPTMDDEFNRLFADTYSFIVVGVNYHKAPGGTGTFPGPVHDIGAIVESILSDSSLSAIVDTANISLAGFSAGGNLSLAVAQLPALKDKIRSIIPVYPVVDFTGQHKGAFRTSPDGKPDLLKDLGPLFNWAYIPPDTDLSNTLLSPICADRKTQLPQRIFFIGAEYDSLCHEAEVMAKKFAGLEEASDTGPQWEENGIKWRMVPDVTHAWTHQPLKNPEAEKKRKKDLEGLYREMADWLRR
ncbi:hypothetical protein LTR99_004446 [Exophiala xenobiotica]|uniref:Alpha/beta hydrolase fold-3 domain-containing protein n=1 Tax=Vermiconidia calcicola TaxID=1690605 RepID=A0AAV9QAS3_9PEZI|nr:hypothetical protein LTR92_000191 [Exophiala xenobiotica]KAK5539726.1 hypothetical protein LTR25_003431 [Vermiconidia calcicola]KAK5541762.1 hypothetical protein LTR23_005613 [Chaetothyriales sp. CCFEE 6169]KAK5274845.1 hypothetical protein LTR96_001446 [Exophiala xenobiotica]KAK5303990.1 hypothetical protein LTR99_004446 [Exophiala xenobiotica]